MLIRKVKKSMIESLEFYNKNGYVVLKSFLEATTSKSIEKFLNLLTLKYESNIDKYKSRFCNFTDAGKVNTLHSLEKHKFVQNILESEDFIGLAQKFLEEAPLAYGSEYFAKPALTGIAVPPHQDNFYWCFNNPNVITIWMALSDVSLSNGALYYYPGSHKHGLFPHSPSNTPGSSQYINDIDSILDHKKKVYVELKKGDVLIHHSLVVHGSGPNTSNKARKGFTIRYSTKDQSINKKAMINYEKSLEKQISQRK